MDGYFDNENSSVESNNSQIKISLSMFYEKDGDPQPGTGLDIKLVLPRFEKRVHLLISGDPDELSGDGEEILQKPLSILPKAEKVPKSAAVRYFFFALERMSLSVDGGANLKGTEPVFFGAGRYRAYIDYQSYNLRFTQWAKWYTDTGSQLKARLEFEWLHSERWFFRASTEANWYEQEFGYFYMGRMEMYHTLSKRSILYYSATVNCETWPENRITNPVVKALHRRNIWRQWFFLEGALQASWPEERKYTFVPAVFIKGEVLFGRRYRRAQ